MAQAGEQDRQENAREPRQRDAARMYVIDPLPVAREGYAAILGGRSGFRVVGRAATLEDAEEELPTLRVDVVILDARMPRTVWTSACARIRRVAPGAGIVVVLEAVDQRLIAEAHVIGLRGVLLRSASPMEIRRAVRAVAGGQTFFDVALAAAPRPGEAAGPAARPYRLTAQQARVLELLTRGLTNREIGAELRISEHTVKTHLTQLMRKLNARDRAHAAVIALRQGLL